MKVIITKKNDWEGNYKSIYSMLGASNHSDYERAENDFYSTDPEAIDYLLKYEQFNNDIWECACGNGNMSKRLEKYGYNVTSTDLVYRGFGIGGIDFLKCNDKFNGDIITNPPYKYATEFVLKALELSERKVAMFLKVQFLESRKRWDKLFKYYPPSTIYVFVKRISCYRNDDRSFKNSAICYSWFVWDKEYNGETKVKWINNF